MWKCAMVSSAKCVWATAGIADCVTILFACFTYILLSLVRIIPIAHLPPARWVIISAVNFKPPIQSNGNMEFSLFSFLALSLDIAQGAQNIMVVRIPIARQHFIAKNSQFSKDFYVHAFTLCTAIASDRSLVFASIHRKFETQRILPNSIRFNVFEAR